MTNVMTDVWRKRALDQRDLFPATFWIRIAVAVVFVPGIAGADRCAASAGRDPRCGLLFGLVQLRAVADLPDLPGARRGPDHHRDVALLPGTADLAAFDVHSVPGLHSGVSDSQRRTSFWGRSPSRIKLLGVALIVVGRWPCTGNFFAVGWLAPVKAVLEIKAAATC